MQRTIDEEGRKHDSEIGIEAKRFCSLTLGLSDRVSLADPCRWGLISAPNVLTFVHKSRRRATPLEAGARFPCPLPSFIGIFPRGELL